MEHFLQTYSVGGSFVKAPTIIRYIDLDISDLSTVKYAISEVSVQTVLGSVT